MGYRSTAKFAVRKDVYLKCQLLQNLPSVLQELEAVPYNDCLYWEIESWKWFSSYPEVAEMESWFEWLEDETENPPTKIERFRDKDNLPVYSEHAAFGAIRLGEDPGDIQEWGSPNDFDLYVASCINSPY